MKKLSIQQKMGIGLFTFVIIYGFLFIFVFGTDYRIG